MKKALGTLAVLALLAVAAPARDKASDRAPGTITRALDTSTAVCTFADGNQLRVRYQRAAVDTREGLPLGKMWPSNGPATMFLFTPVKLTIGGTEIPVGAFSMYVIPEKDHWTLIVNKNVNEGANYDKAQDLLRATMQTGEIGQPAEQFTVYFAHIAPKQCNMRVYYGKSGSWAEFREH